MEQTVRLSTSPTETRAGSVFHTAMLTQRRTEADVQIIFVTDEVGDAEHLAEALGRSARRILFEWHSSCASNLVSILRQVCIDRPFLPTAVVIDYFCKNNRCPEVLRDIRDAVKKAGVELVVANAPEDRGLADELVGLGADVIVDTDTPRCRALSLN